MMYTEMNVKVLYASFIQKHLQPDRFHSVVFEFKF